MEPNLFLLLTVICGRNGGERRGKRKKSDKWKQKKRRKVDSIDGEKTIIMKKGIRGCSTQNSSFLMLNLICSKKLSEVSVFFWMCVLYTYVRSQNVHHFALDIGYLLWSLEMVA